MFNLLKFDIGPSPLTFSYVSVLTVFKKKTQIERWLVNPKTIQLVKTQVLPVWTPEGALVLPSPLRSMPSNVW